MRALSALAGHLIRERHAAGATLTIASSFRFIGFDFVVYGAERALAPVDLTSKLAELRDWLTLGASFFEEQTI
jgi:hypothetical protein